MYEFKQDINRIVEVMIEMFNIEEIKTLCFDIGTDYELLGGSGKQGKARELVAWSFRRKLYADLWNKMATQRPNQIIPTNGFVLPEPEPVQEPVVQKEEFVASTIADMEVLISQLQGKLFELKMATGQMRAK